MWKWIKQEAKNLELWLSSRPKLIKYLDGRKEWYLNGKLHREDGPAVEYANGTKEWYLNGERHREDGPAYESMNGTKEWWLNGEWFHDDYEVSFLQGNYIVIERGIPTDRMFGNIKLAVTRLMTAKGMLGVYDNLPGIDILD